MKRCVLMMCLVLLGIRSEWGFAQNYPNRAIRLIVPMAAGGGTDITARVLAQKLTESLKQPIVVDNRPGAGGSVGVSVMVRSAADGYTFGVVSGSYATNAASYKLNYDPVNDMTLVCLIGESGYLVTMPPAMPIRNIKELIAYAKANPGKIGYGSSGEGGSTHLATALFELMAGVRMTQVPYKSAGAMLTALVGGEIQLVFGATMPATVPQLRAGRVRAIAITTLKRSRLLPDLPTVAESGVPGYESVVWYGVLGPKGISDEITARWNADITAIVHSSEMKERMEPEGLEVPDTSPEYFRKVLRRDIAKWSKVIKDARIQIAQ